MWALFVSVAFLLLTFVAISSPIASASTPKYEVKVCQASSLGGARSCAPAAVDLSFTSQPVPTSPHCEEIVDQGGSVTFADVSLSAGNFLKVEVKTLVSAQDGLTGFFVRPTRKAWHLPKPTMSSDHQTATFFLDSLGQYSVEFAPTETWSGSSALTFDSLMLFVNPPFVVPSSATPITAGGAATPTDLGPNQAYVFSAGSIYDWNADKVFKVHDDTEIYFEEGAHVRARFVQTEKKVDNVRIAGYGIIDVHHALEPDVVGVSDDGTHQAIGIFGKVRSGQGAKQRPPLEFPYVASMFANSAVISYDVNTSLFRDSLRSSLFANSAVISNPVNTPLLRDSFRSSQNIEVYGVTILNTNSDCGAWGYCLNFNANWTPIGDPTDVFGADELQSQANPPSYKPRQAHCQQKNMDDR